MSLSHESKTKQFDALMFGGGICCMSSCGSGVSHVSLSHRVSDGQDGGSSCPSSAARIAPLASLGDLSHARDDYQLAEGPYSDDLLEVVGRWDGILSSVKAAQTPSSSSSSSYRPRRLSDLLRGLDIDEEISTSEPFCLYDPTWFGASITECPRITLSPPAQTETSPSSSSFISPATFFKNQSLLFPLSSRRKYKPSDLLQAPHPSAFLTSPLRITSSYAHDHRWAQLPLNALSPYSRMRHDAEQRREHARRKALRRMWCCFPEPEPRVRRRRGAHTNSSCSRPDVKNESVVVHASFVQITSVCQLDGKERSLKTSPAWRLSEKLMDALGATISRSRLRASPVAATTRL